MHLGGGRHPEAKALDLATTFTLPICSGCSLRITLVKAAVLLVFSAFIVAGVLLSSPAATLDWLIGMGVAGLITSLLLLAFNMFDPAAWLQGRFLFANREYLRLFREANPGVAAEAKPLYEDGVFLLVLSVCVIASALIGAIAIDFLQQRWAPGDAFLLGQAPADSRLLIVPTMLSCTVPAVVLAMHVSDRIHRHLRLAPIESLIASFGASLWAARASFRATASIAAALLAATAVVGFRSYFYVTDTELAVRSPLEDSLRHYRWNDVAVVFLTCRTSSDGVRFSYVLQMTDGRDVDFARVPVRHLAPVLERIGASLDVVSGIQYEFDVAEGALATLGTEYGAGFAEAIRRQVRSHGGLVQP